MAQIPLIPLTAINGGLDWAILVGRRPGFSFKDGKRTSDTPEKYSYAVCLPGNCYAGLSVSIPGGVDALSAITDDQIAEGCATLCPLLVRLTNATVKIYSFNGEQKMSATASGIELVKASK